MPEYIERAVAFDTITDLAGKAPTRSAYEAIWKSARALKKIPTADVTPVIRCKNCKYAYINPSGAILCSVSMQMKKQDGFCDAGDRSDGGADIEID